LQLATQRRCGAIAACNLQRSDAAALLQLVTQQRYVQLATQRRCGAIAACNATALCAAYNAATLLQLVTRHCGVAATRNTTLQRDATRCTPQFASREHGSDGRWCLAALQRW